MDGLGSAPTQERAPAPPATVARLPELGDWEGPLFGELGVLVHEGDTVQCHACGGYFRSLASHAFLAHGLRGAEYRALFGLRRRTPLIGAALLEHRRAVFGPRMRAYQPLHAHYVIDQSHEERVQRRHEEPLRLEARLDPANRQVWEANGRQGQQRRRELLADPTYRATVGKKISESKGGRIEVACAICGTTFLSTRSAASDGQRQLCSPACIREFRRRWAEELKKLPKPGKRAGACEVCGAAFVGKQGQRFCSSRCKHRCYNHQTSGTCLGCGQSFMGSRHQRYCSPGCAGRSHREVLSTAISALGRQRGRPYAAELRALPAAAFAVLSPLERTIVCRYYGLAGGRPSTQRELARDLHITAGRIGELAAQAVARLLADQDAEDVVR